MLLYNIILYNIILYMSIPTPALYLPLTYEPTDVALGLTTSTAAPSYDSNRGLVFNDIYKSTTGSQKFVSIPISSASPPIVPQSTSMTVCFCININEYYPINSLHILSQGKKSVIGPESNAESIDVYYNKDKQLYLTVRLGNNVSLNNGNTLQTPKSNNPVPINSNTWYFVAYTITASASALQISLYVGNKLSMATAKSTVGAQNNIGYNKNYTKSNSNTNLPNTYYDEIQLGDRFHNINKTNIGYGLNGCIRDFMVFNSALTLAQLTTMARTLPAPGVKFPPITVPRSFPGVVTIPTINPQFPYISGLQSLINSFPPPDVSLSLTTAPNSDTATVNSDTTISYDADKGAMFPSSESPTINGTTTNNFINIPMTFTNNLTISFPLYLNYINTNSLSILTLGSNTNEVLSINSNYIEGSGDKTMTNMNCSTDPRIYAISATVYNTAENQNTMINKNKPTYISTVNGYNGDGQLQNNNSTDELTNVGLSQFPANNVVTITGDTIDIFTNPDDYIGCDISGPFITTPSTIESITPLGRISNASSGQILYNFKISNAFTEYPIELSGGDVYQYMVGPKSNASAVVSSPGSHTTTTSSGSNITTMYNGQQFSVRECTWNLVTLVLSSANITLYINNNACTSVAIPTGFTYDTIRLGDTFGNSSLCFVGNLKDFMIYKNILTSDNITKLYNKHILNSPSATVRSYFNQNDIPFLLDSKEENITETFLNIKSKNKFVTMSRLFSIVGLLFYAIGLISNMNYDEVIKNKNVSFALNVLLVITIVVSITN